ncbi:hypothetical protein DVH24_040557 [Malus domestica]|uniref:Uncharacterized protein n=1 Tax=Malus domestica TaxID=3750 RepID=A0A498I844_MALDO|nr:hypothetical protein DVH24_040557 [Malus domestica]
MWYTSHKSRHERRGRLRAPQNDAVSLDATKRQASGTQNDAITSHAERGEPKHIRRGELCAYGTR